MCSAVWLCPTFCHLAPLRLRACLYERLILCTRAGRRGPGVRRPCTAVCRSSSTSARHWRPAELLPSASASHGTHTYKLCSVLPFIGAGVVRGGSRGEAMRITSKNNKSKDSLLLCSALHSLPLAWQGLESLSLSCSQDVWHRLYLWFSVIRTSTRSVSVLLFGHMILEYQTFFFYRELMLLHNWFF